MNCARCTQEMIAADLEVKCKPDGALFRYCTLCKSDNWIKCYKCVKSAVGTVIDGDKKEFVCEFHEREDVRLRTGPHGIERHVLPHLTEALSDVPSHVVPAEFVGKRVDGIDTCVPKCLVVECKEPAWGTPSTTKGLCLDHQVDVAREPFTVEINPPVDVMLKCVLCNEEWNSTKLKSCPKCFDERRTIQANESVVDSALDLANYAIFTAMFEHGECDFTDDEDFFKHYRDTLDTLTMIVRERRAKYGPGNLVIHGAKGTVVRASDKVSRLNNFYFKKS